MDSDNQTFSSNLSISIPLRFPQYQNEIKDSIPKDTSVGSDITTDQNLHQDDRNERNRSPSDFGYLWDVLSPILSSGLWFEKVDSIQPLDNSSLTINSGLASTEICQLIKDYDSSNTPTMKQHEDFKYKKWGEDEFCKFDLNPDDIHLSLTDSITSLPLTDKIAQCVKSYSTYFELWTTYRSPQHSCELPPEISESDTAADLDRSLKLIQSSSSITTVTSDVSTFSSSPAEPHHSFRNASSAIGEVAIPVDVQQWMDVAWMLSRSAGRAIESLITPTCPKRRPRDSIPVSGLTFPPIIPDRDVFCPRRLPKDFLHESQDPSSLYHLSKQRIPTDCASSSEELGISAQAQCVKFDTITGCPRRVACPRRKQGHQLKYQRSKSESHRFKNHYEQDKEN